MSAFDGFKNQRDAADPEASVWVAANAGSGKTRVLIDRVTRLLLTGVRPSAILGLTFTKAAAAEMAIRLNRRLGQWAVLPDDALTKELTELLGRSVQAKELPDARRLFAKTLDAPGGLHIQTIHSFCESVLKRFPLEAGVPPQFSVADDPMQAELIATAREKLLLTAIGDPVLGEALSFVVGELDEGGFQPVLQEVIGNRRKLKTLFAARGGVEGAIEAIWDSLGLQPGSTSNSLLNGFIDGLPMADLQRAARALEQGAPTSQTMAAKMLAWLASPRRGALLDEAWLKLFITDEGGPRKRLTTAGANQADPGAADILVREQQRVVDFIARRNALTVGKATAHLLRLGATLIDYHDAAKRRMGVLDYDDLILGTRDLLHGDGTAAWVLFKLDGGLDHILVDEAQDTSPEQWAVVAALAEEFFAGSGTRDTIRTIFAVGDEKQSIFSFQGADPREFFRMREHFAERVKNAEVEWRAVDLALSFRSSPAVLAAVDHIFAYAAARDGVANDAEPIRHLAHRREAAGLVELWPLAEAEARDAGAPWDAPMDYIDAASPEARLAKRIAETVKRWLDSGEKLESQDRPIRAGDVMILVQRRGAFFEEMVRALKAAAVPVAGADRMLLLQQLAVMDLIVLGRFLLLPDDDLALATVLKGPLCNIDEESLYDLCQPRQARLWPALRARAHERPRWQAALDLLLTLQQRIDFVRPYDFYAEILGVHRGRAGIVARLGAQANDPLDEFLALALAYERQHPPTLEGFLHWLEAGATEIKRDLEQGRNEVRVLTVHGAKGLEAPIVFLPDTCSMPGGQKDDKLLWSEDDQGSPLVFWPVRKINDDPRAAAARDAMKAARLREYRRLLYVALTRARDRLYICGWRGKNKISDGCWYDLVRASLATVPEMQSMETASGPVQRLVSPQSGPAEPVSGVAAALSIVDPLPGWANEAAPAEPIPSRPLAPSRPDLVEPASQSPLGGDDGRRFHRGRLIHRLLQSLPDLPRDDRAPAVRRFLANPAQNLAAAEQVALAAEVLAVLDHPDFAAVFAPGSQAEVPLAGTIGTMTISGQVDRLVVMPSQILLVDYKSNRPPPADVAQVGLAYLRQMALYRAALRQIFPDRPVRAALLWTDGPRLMELPPALLDTAL